MRGSNCNMNLESNPSLENEVELLLLKQQQQQENHSLFLNKEMDFNTISRSGSAPPTVEGALLAAADLYTNPKFEQFNDNKSINGFLTEEEIRLNPAYVEYYYSNMNLNPRLPPPLFSKEDWRVAKRVRAAGAVRPGCVGDLVNNNSIDNCGNSSSWYSMSVEKAEENELMELTKFALRNLGASSSEIEPRRKNYANTLQDGLGNINYMPFGAPNVVADSVDSFCGLSISKGYKQNQQQQYYEKSRAEKLVKNINYAYSAKGDGLYRDLNISNSVTNEQMSFPRSVEDIRMLSQGNDFFPDMDASSQGHGGYTYNQNLDMMCDDDLSAELLMTDAIGDGWTQRSSNRVGIKYPAMGPDQFQYLHGWNMANSPHGHEHLQALERAYMEALLVQQAQQYLPHSSHMFQNDRKSHFPSTGNNMKGRFESLLDTAKHDKTKSLKLSDILGHVVEFSMDQYGSRFIQQKLEIATPEEKIKIFTEIIPHARNLMTNVFGNYVIQKIFEHGTDSQRRELASQLIGHVLPLSLQMYGCRVIQKALEVVDVELQTKMVAELNDSVMKCILDQNGNHVIQKCMECVPQDRIQFIISSLLGQVVILSSHPYGCRVIQRALQHCVDPKTQQIFMDEIMSSVCKLAQDQYGNYVLQHILQHGKPQERSAIISKLAGQIVKMSQQKFASNVIEKCLTFGAPEERKLLVKEMLGSTDENEPLQAMMKDPFGNYVVQKVLETCDDHSRDLILSRIKVHLNALKRYTYGKHIVSRVEKLVAMGERQIGISVSSY